jgi:hypothetical protein
LPFWILFGEERALIKRYYWKRKSVVKYIEGGGWEVDSINRMMG